MPIYLFENPDTGEIKEVILGMNEEHIYQEGEVKWDRVWTKPRAAIDTKIDPNSEKDFSRAVDKRGMTIDDMWGVSKELSDKRGGEDGDPVRQKAYAKYEKETGKKHPEKKQKFETKDAYVEL